METIVRRIGLVAHDAMKKDMICLLYTSDAADE